MSFFHEVSTPFNKTKDPRVKAWGQGEISTAATPGYEKKAKDAQAAASNATSKSSIQGGKIVKAVHADNPRPSLPSNVRGLHNVNTGDDGSDVDCLPERGRLPNDAHSRGTRKDERSAWAKGPRQTTTQQPRANKKTPKWSVLDLSSMVERDDNASSLKTYENPPACSLAQATVADYAVKTCLPPASTTSQKNMTSVKNSATAPVHAQSFASRASEKAPAVPQQFSSITTASSSLPPHMRPPPKIKPSEDTFAASAVQPIKSRKAAKSAKHNSPFPCTYEDCTRGFLKEKDMKKHKDKEHPWCRACRKDFADEEDLLQHKIEMTERHICCQFCGEDFRSDGGRDKHVKQFHPTLQEIICPGCGMIFFQGSALVSHIWSSKCPNIGGRFPGSANEFKIRESRAKASLQMVALAWKGAESAKMTAKMIEDIQPLRQKSVTDTASLASGVVSVPNYMDDEHENVPMSDTMQKALMPAGLTDPKGANAMGIFKQEWPIVAKVDALEEPKKTRNLEKLQQLQICEAVDLTLRDYKGPQLPVDAYPDRKPMPKSIDGDWGPPTMPDYRLNIFPSEAGKNHVLRTDWDWMVFEPNSFDSHYHCPFEKCRASYLEINDLKAHLTSGYHQGTHEQCHRCLKRFSVPHALVAHMESNACGIQTSRDFPNIMHVVSGGFLGVSGLHIDGSVKIECPKVEPKVRHVMHLEEDDDDEDGEEVKQLKLSQQEDAKMLPPSAQLWIGVDFVGENANETERSRRRMSEAAGRTNAVTSTVEQSSGLIFEPAERSGRIRRGDKFVY